MISLDYTNFHAFLAEHPNAVLFARQGEWQEFSPLVAKHIQAARPEFSLGTLTLGISSSWFAEETAAVPGRPRYRTNGYYLVIGGRMVRFHSGAADKPMEAFASAVVFGFAKNDMSASASMLEESNATAVITEFERLLSRLIGPQRPSAPKHSPLNDGKSPHSVLGVGIDASKSEIMAAYRNAAKQNHPDKVASLAPEFRELAERQMTSLNWARDELLAKAKR